MKTTPILFSAPMVRALLDGSKTQTRRVLKPTKRDAECLVWIDFPEGREFYNGCADGSHVWADGNEYPIAIPYGVGDLLWVRETFFEGYVGRDGVVEDWKQSDFHYRATEPDIEGVDDGDGYSKTNKDGSLKSPWKPAIHMPRKASRLTLEVTSVKVERLHEITDADAKAEGAARLVMDDDGGFFESDCGTYRCGFAGLWSHINGAESWDANPWIVAVTFKVHRVNVDAFPATAKEAA